MYEYNAVVKKIIDGDTIDVEVDLGFDIKYDIRIRLSRIDAYETKLTGTLSGGRDPIYDAELLRLKELGLKGAAFVKETIPVGVKVLIITQKDKTEKYGRYLAEVYYYKENKVVCLNDEMVNNGYATYIQY